jgi:phage terminase small subunit
MDKGTIKNYLIEIQDKMFKGEFILAYSKLKFVLEEIKYDELKELGEKK